MIYVFYFAYVVNIISLLYPAIFKSKDTLDNGTFGSGVAVILMSLTLFLDKLEIK